MVWLDLLEMPENEKARRRVPLAKLGYSYRTSSKIEAPPVQNSRLYPRPECKPPGA